MIILGIKANRREEFSRHRERGAECIYELVKLMKKSHGRDKTIQESVHMQRDCPGTRKEKELKQKRRN